VRCAGAGVVTRNSESATGAYTVIGALTSFFYEESTGVCTTANESFSSYVSVAQNYAWISATLKK
jgi:hypothetical protein